MLSRDAFETVDENNKAVSRLANSITQKLKRANKNLEKVFQKRQILDSLKAIK